MSLQPPERLSDLFVRRGVPQFLRSENGPEFTAEKVRKWLHDQHPAVKSEQLSKLPTVFETRSPGAYSSLRIATNTGEQFHLLSSGGQASA